MSREQVNRVRRDQVCPYCGSPVVIKDSSSVYGEKFKGKRLYVCSKYPRCDSFGSQSVANKRLRRLRRRCHELFDPFWKSKGVTRTQAYKHLSLFFKIPNSKAHIGLFDEEQCRCLISVLEAVNVCGSHRNKQSVRS